MQWALVLEAAGGGALAGCLAALTEMGARAIWPGGSTLSQLAPNALAILGTYSVALGCLGTGWGLVFLVLPDRLGGGEPCSRSAIASLATGAAICASFVALDPYHRQVPRLDLLVVLVLGTALALAAAWLARGSSRRVLNGILGSASAATALGFLLVLGCAFAAPVHLLGEPLSVVRSVPLRLGYAFAGWIPGVFLLAGLLRARARLTGRGLPRAALASLLGTALLASLLRAAPWSAPPRLPTDAPNLVLVVIDTLRADHLPIHGYERNTAPTISSLAARGAVFLDAVSTASFTMPSMASLMTARLPFEHGVRVHPARLPPGELTLAEILRERGYVTGAVVSNLLLSRQWGFDQGFDYFDVHTESPLGGGRLLLSRVMRWFGRGNRADDTARSAAAWISRHTNDPFFLWVHFIDPHFPYAPPYPFDRLFSSGSSEAYDELLAGIRREELVVGDVGWASNLPSDAIREGRDRYDGEIAFVDHQLGRILETLRDPRIDRDTLLVVTSDHGEAFGEHGVLFQHGFTTYETLMRVPLLMVWPGRIPPDRRIDAQVSLVDLAPTILELLGVAVPRSMSGTSLVPLFADTRAPWRALPAYGENLPLLPGHPTHAGAVRFGGIFRSGMQGKWRMLRLYPWKLIHVPGRPDGEDMLFQLELDPGELEDRASSDTETLQALRARLEPFLVADRSAPAGRAEAIGAEELEKLRALGYAE